MQMQMMMKMDFISLHLSSSRYATLFCLRFLFLLLFTIYISCLPHSSAACPEPFQCGNQTFQYPFGAKNSGCGDPALQLHCDYDVNMTIITIEGYEYYVLPHEFGPWPYFTTKQMGIVDKKMWGDKCEPSTSDHTMELWSNPQFRFSGEYINVSLWGDCRAEQLYDFGAEQVYALECNKTWYYSSIDLGKYCKSLVELPVEKEFAESHSLFLNNSITSAGFIIEWSPSKGCEYCESEKNPCIYDVHNSTQLRCKSPAGTKTSWSIILGSAIGSLSLVLMGGLVLFVNRKRCLSTSSDISNVEKFLQDYVHQMPCRYSYSNLIKITNKFADKVGEGGFGVVYKGKLPNGDLVAVKMLDQSRRCENQFMNEIATIGRIHHVHLVRLMGYCYDEHRNALVYEYMGNGSLDNFIFAGRKKEQILNWAQLYSIALGAARGIAYLHQDCNNRIIHFDIKPHNILLDEEFTTKIADFGLAKLCGKKEDHISMTAARGTPGYCAPEVWNRNLGAITDKSDVYSFGMVLLEVVGGRKNIDVQVSRSSQMYFPEWAFKLMENGQLERALGGIESEELEKAIRLAKVGMWCIQYNSKDRPSMSRVVQMLEGNGDDIGNPPLPFTSPAMAAASVHSSEESSL